MDEVKETMNTVERVANYTSNLMRKIQLEFKEKN